MTVGVGVGEINEFRDCLHGGVDGGAVSLALDHELSLSSVATEVFKGYAFCTASCSVIGLKVSFSQMVRFSIQI